MNGMPIYEYKCKSCGEEFDALRRLRDDDRDVECPKCHERNAQRKISLSAFEGAIKGGGCGHNHGPMKFG
jgi:putative FmdB family regulatory protein